jgi:hypothetical protein
MATAADSQGIMALPMEGAPADTGAPAQPQLGLDDSYDAVQQGLQNASPDAYTAVNDELAKLAPQLDQLPDEVLDQLLQIVQYMHDRPEEYAQLLKELVDAGIIEQGDFPEEYDPEFLATMGMVIMQARKTRQGAQQGAMPIQQAPVPPANMARGGIAEAAHMVASRGRGQDTMLAHITPREAQMLRSKGGMGTINPATGLPEYGWFSDTVKSVGGAISGAVKGVTGAVTGVVKGVAGAVKDIVSSPIGKVLATVALATFLGPGAFGVAGLNLGATASMALASGAVTALGGGNIKDVLKSAAIGGATAFFGAPGGAVSNFVGGAVTNAAANAAITSGIVGTGIGLLSGQKLQDAVKSGITAGAISGLSTGATKGFTSQISPPELGTVADMAKNQAGENISGKFNPETGKYELPEVVNRDTIAGQNAADLKPVMDPATGGVRTVAADGRTYQVFTRPDGTPVFQPATGTGANAPAFMKGDVIPSANAQGATPTSMDPLGDFIQQNDAARSLANTPARVPEPSMFDKAKGLYNEYLSPSGIKEAAIPQAEAAGQAAYDRLARSPESIRAAAYQRAYEAAMPGVLGTYGPMIGAGLGIASLGGAFTPTPPQPTQMQSDINQRLADEKARVAANPGAYAPQGMERFGIKYNDRGEIIGSQPFNPQPTGPTEVAGNYMPYTPSPYMTPSGAIGSGTVYQPYNNANMYNFMPRYAAMGGIMSNAMPPSPVMRDMGGIASLAKGGYPRRTGQISGPGTATSDSIPAMLSDGEFVMTAKAVRGAGKGDRLSGAKKMYALMHQLERNAARG